MSRICAGRAGDIVLSVACGAVALVWRLFRSSLEVVLIQLLLSYNIWQSLSPGRKGRCARIFSWAHWNWNVCVRAGGQAPRHRRTWYCTRRDGLSSKSGGLFFASTSPCAFTTSRDTVRFVSFGWSEGVPFAAVARLSRCARSTPCSCSRMGGAEVRGAQ